MTTTAHAYPQAGSYWEAVLAYLATGRVHELPDGDLVIRIGSPARYRRVSPATYGLIQERRVRQRWEKHRSRQAMYDRIDTLIEQGAS